MERIGNVPWSTYLVHVVRDVTSNRHHAQPTTRAVPPLFIVLSRCGISQVIAARKMITSNSWTKYFCWPTEMKRVAHGGLSPPAHSLCLNAFTTSTSSSLSPKGRTLATRRVCFRFVVCTLSVYSFLDSLSTRFKGPYISISFTSGSRKECILRGSGAGMRATTAL
jgi:hypothetical protein